MNKFDKIQQRSLKKAHKYKLLSEEEKKIANMMEDKDRFNRELYGFNGFYSTFPRNKNGAINWEKIEDSLLDVFDHVRKKHEKLSEKLNQYTQEELSKINEKILGGYGGSF